MNGNNESATLVRQSDLGVDARSPIKMLGFTDFLGM